MLPIITLGIYHLVWWYKINRELRDYGDSKGYDLGQSPTNSLLALFPGGFIIIPPLISYWRGTHRIQGAARLARTEPPNGWIALILYIVLGLGFPAYLQYYLNHVWQTDADPLPGPGCSAGAAGLDAASPRGRSPSARPSSGAARTRASDAAARARLAVGRGPGGGCRRAALGSPASAASPGRGVATCRCPPAPVR